MVTGTQGDEATLPIRRLTLYKHGVGFVEREGEIDGDIIEPFCLILLAV